MSTKLPLKKFGEVCTFVRGPFGGSLKKSEFKESGYVVYEQQHAIGNQFSQVRYYIDDEKFNDMKRFELLSGDLIMSCSGTMGRVAIVPNNIPRGIINQALLKLTPSNNLDVNYLQYWMESNDFQESIAKFSVGAAIKNVASVKILKQIDIPFPPLPEQKQIVQTLDRAFAQLDLAKTHLEKNLHNAQELFASKLNEVFSQRGEGWVEYTLEEVCKKVFAGGDAPKGNFSKTITDAYTIPIYANAVKNNGLYGYTDIARVTEPSISIAARGSGTGHTEIRNEPFFPIVRLIVLIPNYELIELKFLKYVINTLDILRSGSAIPQLTVPMIKQYKVYIPEVLKQKILIDELDKLFEKTEEIQMHYQQKLTNLEELKKSILEKAFRGEL